MRFITKQVVELNPQALFFTAQIQLDNDAFRNPCDLANLLRIIAFRVDDLGNLQPYYDRSIIDENGNLVGSHSIKTGYELNK